MKMPVTAPPLDGEDLLRAVTSAMVDLHERYHGRPPVSRPPPATSDL
jgi:hypothetical protein